MSKFFFLKIKKNFKLNVYLYLDELSLKFNKYKIFDIILKKILNNKFGAQI